jgi:hypothetical protein
MLLLLLGLAAVVGAWLLGGRLRSRLDASMLVDELRETGIGTWRAVPVDRAGGPLSPRMVAGEVGGDEVEVAGSLLFLPFEHSRELAILRQETPALASEAFVPAGVATLDGALAFRSADAAWLRGFLARDDVRSALAKLCARAEADSSFGAVRAGRGVGEIALRRLVGRRSGPSYFRDPEGGPFDAADVRDLVQILAPLKRALS